MMMPRICLLSRKDSRSCTETSSTRGTWTTLGIECAAHATASASHSAARAQKCNPTERHARQRPPNPLHKSSTSHLPDGALAHGTWIRSPAPRQTTGRAALQLLSNIWDRRTIMNLPDEMSSFRTMCRPVTHRMHRCCK